MAADILPQSHRWFINYVVFAEKLVIIESWSGEHNQRDVEIGVKQTNKQTNKQNKIIF